MGCAHRDFQVLKWIFVWSVTIFQTTDGSNITWYEPPPSETVSDPAITSVTRKNLTKGLLNEKLICSFDLTADMSLVVVTFEFGGVVVANYFQSRASVPTSFASRFDATWVPTKLTLIVFNVTSDDRGEYLCRVQANSDVLKTWQRKIEVDVLVQPQITNISGKIVTEGGNVTLKCLAEGNPKPTITWMRLLNNIIVTMPLANIRRKDAGYYKCIAGNGVGSPGTGNAFIDVQYPVEPTGSGENATVPEGSVKNFSCPVAGNPGPSIKWYKGIELRGAPISNEKLLEARETGCYTCVASNYLGASVSITHCLLFNTSQELPTTITNPTSTPVSEGPPWTVIGIVVGVAMLLAIVVGLVTCRIRKKRKYKEATRRNELRYEEIDHLDVGDNLARKASSE